MACVAAAAAVAGGFDWRCTVCVAGAAAAVATTEPIATAADFANCAARNAALVTHTVAASLKTANCSICHG